jgi:glycosyltransferase involved in cell wall biosynthesis
MSRSKVSICVPLYNSERFIGRTLESILGQTYEDFELIVSDNASTDNSLKIVEEFRDVRLKVLKNDKTTISEENWDKCIKNAAGDLIALYHSDDVYEPTIVEKEIAQFDEHPELGAVFTAGNIIDADGKKIGVAFLDDQLAGNGPTYFNKAFLSLFEVGKGSFICPSAMIPKKVYQEIGLYSNSGLRYAFDYDLYLRVLEKHPVKIINERLINYRNSPDQGTKKVIKKGIYPNEFYALFNRFIRSPALTAKIGIKFIKAIKANEKRDFYLCAANALQSDKMDYALQLLMRAIEINPNLFDEFVKYAVRKGFVDRVKNVIIRLKG